MRHSPYLALALLCACGQSDQTTGITDSSTGAQTSGSSESTETGDETTSSTSAGPTTDGTAGSSTGSTSSMTASTSASTTDATTDATTGDPPPLELWDEHRGALHVHSPFSHDACDGAGLMNGVPNASCLADLRAAICATGLDFVHLTDHPSYMKEHPFEALLLYKPGDELVLEDGAPIANRIACPDDSSALLTVGYESTHTLPLGLRHHVDEAFYGGLTDQDALADSQALVAALQGAGAFVAIAHSEEEDLSAQRIIDAGLDGMEWYNPHGNFLTALGGDTLGGDLNDVLGLIDGLSAFMVGSDSGAHPDLVYLWLLPSWPQEGFDKWREVLRARPITGLLGDDVHQNVSVDPICAFGDPLLQAACVAAAEAALPPSLAGLVSGGSLIMLDGDRLDSYARILRWLENRALLPPGEALTPDTLRAALQQGRSYGLFSVFGDPEGFAFVADTGDATLQIGDSHAGPLALTVQTPTPAPFGNGGAEFTDAQASTVKLRAALFHTDSEGTEEVASLDGPGARLEYDAASPGAYHVELWVYPEHLREALGDQEALADTEYLWVISNPIFVEG
ncbi:MAG: hypothetical protein H6713_04375 [Myxococcales bacterium]|nr:hypothetical protein [Myxococcales bacterium]MCB9749227.1 hypothetical protein [Myxococcales bacterium]